MPYARGLYVIDVENLPDGWRLLRILRRGAPLTGNQLLVGRGERIDGIEIHLVATTIADRGLEPGVDNVSRRLS